MVVALENMFETIMKMLEDELLLKKNRCFLQLGASILDKNGDVKRINPKRFVETLAIAGMIGCKAVAMPETVVHTPTDGSPQLTKPEHEKFRTIIIGRLFSNVDDRVGLLTSVRECAT